MLPANLLNATLTILKNSPADPAWGSADGYSGTQTSVPCRIQSASLVQTVDGKVRQEADYTVYLDFRADIGVADRVLVDGIEYEVVEIRDAAGHHHHIELGVRRI